MEEKNKSSEPNKYQELIDKYKAVGRETYTITCNSGEMCLCLEPTLIESAPVLSFLMSAEPDIMKAGQFLFDKVWIAGDDLIRTDPELKAEVCLSLVQLAKIKIADVKKN